MRVLNWIWGKIGWARLFGIALLIVLLAIRISDPVFVQIARLQSFDFYQRLKPREYTKQPVAIIDIDEASLKEIGQWPWPRSRMAELVAKLTSMGMVAIAFDIVFSEDDRLSPPKIAKDNPQLPGDIRVALSELPENDDVFAGIIKQSRVVLGQTSVRSAEDNASAAAEIPPVSVASKGVDPKRFLPGFPALVQNLPVLESAAAGRGVFTVQPDADGIYRRVPLAVRVGDQLRLTLSAELLRVATGGFAFTTVADAAGMSGIVIANKLVNTDSEGKVWPYFTDHRADRFISAADVLGGRVPVDRIRGHLLLVGTSAVGLEDFRATPFVAAMPGVEIHAQILENVLTDQMLIRPNYAIGMELLFTVAVSLLIIAIVPMLGAIWAFFAATLFLGVFAAGSLGAFWQYRLLIDASYPLATIVMLFIAMATANYIREERQRQQIRSAFGQYISPEVVDQLSEDPDRLVLGGEKRDLSVMFTDVRGFTTISESFKDDPEGLTQLMNDFLTTMSNAIHDYGGTIDKFMGDAVMAFWNAPLDQPDHAVRSCRSAMKILSNVAELNEARASEHDDSEEPPTEINIGIGINSGDCIVGNMGSESRFDYTALGDRVNLASRLEGSSKLYGLPIILGESTASEVEGELAVIEVDMIRVKGKNEPERIFALVGDEEMASSEAFVSLRALNRSMISSYRTQDWQSALDALDLMATQMDESDIPLGEYLLLYETRIAEFRANPPGKSWDGVYTALSK